MYLILKRFAAIEEENKTKWQAKLEQKNKKTGEKITTTIEAPTKDKVKEIISGNVGSLYELDLTFLHEGNGSTLEDFGLDNDNVQEVQE